MDIDTNFCNQFENVVANGHDVVEEIDEHTGIKMTLGKPKNVSPVKQDIEIIMPDSPIQVKREFGNISPISELLDDDAEVEVPIIEEDTTEPISPEPGVHPMRTSFPRISDGRSSPILAYSPSLVKSPSSNAASKASRAATSSPNSGVVGKRPRNIARMLDNISDHSSGEEEVNNVEKMMGQIKFTT